MNPLLYIHKAVCISPQQTFATVDLQTLQKSVDNKLLMIEPAYEDVPPGLLRRMGRAVRAGVGAALPVIKEKTDGIIIGTANGGMEDCIRFLNQIIDYDEGMLTPGNFVQSTANAIAGQLGMMSRNTGYNITHVHRALAFENALLDAMMLLEDHADASYLVGGVDEISAYNYNIDYLAGWYKKESISNDDLFTVDSPASMAGEGAAMFLVKTSAAGAIAKVDAMLTLHEDDEVEVTVQCKDFLSAYLNNGESVDLFLTGENGDNRLNKYYTACEPLMKPTVAIARFKHMTGEYPTASAAALWICCQILRSQEIPQHMIKNRFSQKPIGRVLIYNNYKGAQHSFILLSDAGKEK